MHARLLALHPQYSCDRTEVQKYNIYRGVENGTLRGCGAHDRDRKMLALERVPPFLPLPPEVLSADALWRV